MVHLRRWRTTRHGVPAVLRRRVRANGFRAPHARLDGSGVLTGDDGLTYPRVDADRVRYPTATSAQPRQRGATYGELAFTNPATGQGGHGSQPWAGSAEDVGRDAQRSHGNADAQGDVLH